MNVNISEILNLIDSVGITKDINTIALDASLSQSGIDSLEMMNILLAIEEHYHIKIPDQDIPELDSINQIQHYLNAR